MLPELATYLASQGCGTLGVDLFMGKLPDTPVACVAMYEAPSPAPLMAFDGVALEKSRVLIYVRAAAYSDARQRADKIYQLCLAIKHLVLSSAIYLAVIPDRPPTRAPRDAHHRPMVGLNVVCWKQLTPLE